MLTPLTTLIRDAHGLGNRVTKELALSTTLSTVKIHAGQHLALCSQSDPALAVSSTGVRIKMVASLSPLAHQQAALRCSARP